MTPTQEQRAEAIRAKLEQVRAEIDATQTATEEMLSQVEDELHRTGLTLANAQMELVFKRAWNSPEKGDGAV
jgi:hypothetical protein